MFNSGLEIQRETVEFLSNIEGTKNNGAAMALKEGDARSEKREDIAYYMMADSILVGPRFQGPDAEL